MRRMSRSAVVWENISIMIWTKPLRRFWLIRGWEKGIINQPAGSKLTLIIPSALGYGPQDLGIIPANSSLIFDIEIVSVK